MNKKMNLAPIVFFVYNRLWHTEKTVKYLKKNELAQESELFIYSDAPRNDDDKNSVNDVRNYIKNITGFKKIRIIIRKKNFGLADSIIDGVTKIVNKYGNVIVLEDDLVTSPYFLRFMNESLDKYKDDDRIFVISGYSPKINLPSDYNKDVYLTHRSSSWGWSTWKNEWNSINWKHEFYEPFLNDNKLMKMFARKGGTDRLKMLKLQFKGEINSWAIRRAFTQFLQKKYTVYPSRTLLNNIGHDGSGVHCGVNSIFDSDNYIESKVIILPDQVDDNKYINLIIYKYYSISFKKRVIKKIRKLIRL